MARQPRIHLPGGYYHVMVRGNGGNDIFFSSADRNRFLLFVQEGIERYGHRVHAFCLMDNHVHLLIQVGATPLSKVMQNLGFRYTRYINKKRKTVGHLFQGRFKSILVEADSYLLELVRYIHLNPVRAGMCESADAYEWSSHRCYLGSTAIAWLHTEEVLGRFSSHEQQARSLYAEFVEKGHGEKWRKDFHHGSHLGQILGTDHFADIAIKTSDQSIPQPRKVLELLTAVCEVYGVEVERMYDAGNGRPYSEIRGMVAMLIQEREGVKLTSLAKELGRDLSALSKAGERMRQRVRKEEAMKMRYSEVLGVIESSTFQA